VPASLPRLVYSTDASRRCPKCGWPQANCRCAKHYDAEVPARIVAKLRLETAGRAGKAVTAVYDLPRNAPLLKELASELKRACGSGGTVEETRVEIQGDHRETIRQRLRAKGWTVKG
jgi:translation initiation factor 1